MKCQLTDSFTRTYSSGGGCRNAKLVYLVSGCDPDETDPGAAAIEAVRAIAPEELGSAKRISLSLLRNHGGGTCEIQVEYDLVNYSKITKKIGDMKWSFSAGCTMEHITTAPLRRRISRSGNTAPDAGELVRWNGKFGEGFRVDGTSRFCSIMHEHCVATFRASDVTDTFRRNIMDTVGYTNAETFHSWSAEEVLFLGASSSPEFRNENNVKLIDITFRFAIRPIRQNLYVEGVNAGNVSGWDYLWAIDRPDPAGGAPAVDGIYISRLYESRSFSVLKIH